jgi:hypothetical protein
MIGLLAPILQEYFSAYLVTSAPWSMQHPHLP